MGIIELAFLCLAALLTVVLIIVVSRRGAPKPPRGAEVARRSVLPPLFLALGGLAVAPLAGWVLAPFVIEQLSGALPSAVDVPADPRLSRLYGAVPLAAWVAAPSVMLLGWAVLSSRRSPLVGIAFAAATAVGSTLGLVVSLIGVVLTHRMLSEDPYLLTSVPLTDVMLALMYAAVPLALFGGCIGAVGVISAASDRGLRVAVGLTAALPLLAAMTAALATPPDPLSFLLVAPSLVVFWLAALVAGAVFRRLRHASDATAPG